MRLSILGVVLFFFCSSVQADEITVYSNRHYKFDGELLEKFTKQSGVKVNVVKADADELIERLASEGDKSPADVIFTADAGRLHRAKEQGLLQAVKSDVLEKRVPKHLRDSDGHWFGFTMRARVIVYSKERVKPSELSTYEDLADPKWRGRIVCRSSSNIYNQSLLGSIIANSDEKEALKWATAVRANMARPPQGSDRDQIRAVAKGLADVAIANTYYVGLLENSESEEDKEAASKTVIFFPNQDGRGAHVNVSGGGVTKASRNPGAARKLLEFLVSDEVQKSFPFATYEYPVVEGIPLSDGQKKWGTFKADTLALEELGKNNKAAVKLFNKAGWE